MATKQQARLTSLADLNILSKEGKDALQKFQQVARVATPRPAMDMSFNRRLGRLPRPSEDGVTHINTSTAATTPVGQALSIMELSPYYDSLLEIQVSSLMHFHRWLSSGMANVNDLTSPSTKQRRGDKAKGRVPQYNALMAHAIYSKLKSLPDLATVLMGVTTRIDCYTIRRDNNGAEHADRSLTGAAHACALLEARDALRDKRKMELWKFLEGADYSRISVMPPKQRHAATRALLQEIMAKAIIAIKEAKEAKTAAPAVELQRNGDTIAGASDAAYTPTPEDEGNANQIKVAVASPGIELLLEQNIKSMAKLRNSYLLSDCPDRLSVGALIAHPIKTVEEFEEAIKPLQALKARLRAENAPEITNLEQHTKEEIREAIAQPINTSEELDQAILSGQAGTVVETGPKRAPTAEELHERHKAIMQAAPQWQPRSESDPATDGTDPESVKAD